MEAAPGTDKVVTITDGQSTGDVAYMLRNCGLIDSELTLQIQKRFYEYEFHPGTYALNTSMTSKEILQVLNEGTGEEETIEENETSAKMTDAEAAETTEAENRETMTAAVETTAADSDHTEVEITIDHQETASAQAEETDEIEIRIE
jgi:cell division protein YceG involved in septum cleavage